MASNVGTKIGYGRTPDGKTYNIYQDTSGKETKVPTTGAGPGGYGGKEATPTSPAPKPITYMVGPGGQRTPVMPATTGGFTNVGGASTPTSSQVSTVTIVDKDTGKVIQQGYTPPDNNTFMSQDAGYVAQREKEFDVTRANLPIGEVTKLSVQEQLALQKKLDQPTQSIQASTFGGVASSQTLVDARIALAKPESSRTAKDVLAIQSAFNVSGARQEFVRQQEQQQVQQQLRQQQADQYAEQQKTFQPFLNEKYVIPNTRVIDSKLPFTPEASIPVRDVVVAPRISADLPTGTKVVQETPGSLLGKGRPLEAFSKMQEQIEKDISKDKQVYVDKAGLLFLASVGKGVSNIIQPGAEILAPIVQQGNFAKSGSVAVAKGTFLGGALAGAVMRPVDTAVGITRQVITKPISFGGELVGGALAFKGLGTLAGAVGKGVSRLGTIKIDAIKLTQPKVLKSIQAGKSSVPTSTETAGQLAKRFSTGQSRVAQALGQPYGGLTVSGEKLFNLLKKKLNVGYGKSEYFQPGVHISTDASLGFARVPGTGGGYKLSLFSKTPKPSAVFVKTKVSVSPQIAGRSMIEQAKALGFDVSKLRPDIQKYIVDMSKKVASGQGKMSSLKIKYLQEKFGVSEIEKAFSTPTVPSGQAFITPKRLMGSPEIEAIIPPQNVLEIATSGKLLEGLKGYKFRTSVSGVDIPIYITEPVASATKTSASISQRLSSMVSQARLKSLASSSRDFEKGVTYVPIVSSKSLALASQSFVKTSQPTTSVSSNNLSSTTRLSSSYNIPNTTKLSYSPSSISKPSVVSSPLLSSSPSVSSTRVSSGASSSVSQPVSSVTKSVSVSTPSITTSFSKISRIGSQIKSLNIPSRTPSYKTPSRLVPRITPPLIPPPIYYPKTGPVSFSRQRLPRVSEAYKVVTRVGGKEKVLRVGVPKNVAINVGSRFVGETPARSFKIVKIGLTKKQDVPIRAPMYKFREPVSLGKVAREGFKFVEKSKYAIESPGEKEGIPGKATRLRRAGLIGKKGLLRVPSRLV